MSDKWIEAVPYHMLAAELWRSSPYGPVRVWVDGYTHNVVVDQGKGQLLNRMFGGGTASSVGAFLQLHSATTASNHVWSNISASQVASYGANVPLITFASTYTVGSASGTQSYAFTAGTQTISGGALQFYTTNTMSTNAATAGILHYAEGNFVGGSRQAQNGDSLSVSVTVSYA